MYPDALPIEPPSANPDEWRRVASPGLSHGVKGAAAKLPAGLRDRTREGARVHQLAPPERSVQRHLTI
jgi:hypothetical protein